MSNEYFLDEYEPIQQQMIESNRDICLTTSEANELLRLIDQTTDYVVKSMKHGYYLDLEFLHGLSYWVSYDRHVSMKQMVKFWALYNQLPEKTESGLL